MAFMKYSVVGQNITFAVKYNKSGIENLPNDKHV
jgi:hypothetical protein